MEAFEKKRKIEPDHSYLSGQASVKDDLQAIFSLNREIGTAVYTVLKHLELIRHTLDEEVPDSNRAVTAELEAVGRSLDSLQKDQETILKKLESHETASKVMMEYHKDLGETEAVNHEHFDRIVKIIYTRNGYDEKGNKIPEAILKIERWSKLLHSAFWSFVTTSILSGIFYMFAKAREEATVERTKAMVEVLDRAKDAIEKQQKALEEHKTAPKK